MGSGQQKGADTADTAGPIAFVTANGEEEQHGVAATPTLSVQEAGESNREWAPLVVPRSCVDRASRQRRGV